ncbi:hypothetical protein M5X02_30880 [Paenibacillus alvei]|uniref:hypothetical protein n=1 Tax=Paenibacillus alvei TaxID=44250 RepID=UPI0002886115|nr:hypothetical protein [Paenibacillus alvei]EJW14099.1 hypothetical protein PAV_141p02050 [Paenibacillus alvei DSM 29]MCY9545032.1 hypothetical protein [Paenibacillus alvei]MCY9707752.1 hypothetical protein [Paenibacillus alvei]MEC0082735.1 hypothetical protein [Paenibacillus alvei]
MYRVDYEVIRRNYNELYSTKWLSEEEARARVEYIRNMRFTRVVKVVKSVDELVDVTHEFVDIKAQ